MKDNKCEQDKKGCKVIFASADLSSFENSNNKEEKAILSNCNTKIILKKNDNND